jgi:prepilin-type N-terminal cleavage/methylation domain-containing protein
MIVKLALAKGFTIIEFMITVAIVAILVAIASPSLDRFTTAASLDMAAESFQSSLGYARSEALKRGQTVSLRPFDVTAVAPTTAAVAGDWARGWQIFIDHTQRLPACVPGITPNDQLIRQHELNRARTGFRATNAGNCVATTALSCISFDARGKAIALDGTPITPTLCVTDTRYPAMTRRISLNAEGQYYLESVTQ